MSLADAFAKHREVLKTHGLSVPESPGEKRARLQKNLAKIQAEFDKVKRIIKQTENKKQELQDFAVEAQMMQEEKKEVQKLIDAQNMIIDGCEERLANFQDQILNIQGNLN